MFQCDLWQESSNTHTHTDSIFFTLRMESKLVEEASLHPLVIILSCVNCLANHLELNVIKIYSRLIWSVMVLRMYGIAFFLNTSPLNQLLDTETRPSTHTLKQIIYFFFFTEWWLVWFWGCYKSFSAFPTHFSLENTPLYYCYVQNVISEIFDVHSFEHLYNYKYEVWNTAFFRFCLGKQLLLFEKKNIAIGARGTTFSSLLHFTGKRTALHNNLSHCFVTRCKAGNYQRVSREPVLRRYSGPAVFDHSLL